jgi:hypothetical protein
MLRHDCGFALANKGNDTRALQAYLGHKNIGFERRAFALTTAAGVRVPPRGRFAIAPAVGFRTNSSHAGRR